MTHLSLFSGIGGIDLAAERVGFKTIAFVERDPFCQRVLKKNWPEVPVFDDVTTVDGTQWRGKTTLVSGGFPCQPHSLAGKRKASGDERDLWSECVRIIRETQAEWFLGENVRGLLTSESGNFFGRILRDLAELGMDVGWGCFPASIVGAPHERARVFLVAHTDSKRHKQKRMGYTAADRISWESQAQRRKDWFGINLDFEGVAPSKWWPAEESSSPRPLLCGTDDGIPRTMDRLRTLGNAVCPDHVEPILREMVRATKQR